MPSPKKPCTRYGPIKGSDIRFGTEERFQWQKAKFVSDVVYDLPESSAKSIVFGSSLRKGMDDGEAAKSSTGPGSYDFSHCYDKCSEYPTKMGNRFAAAPRQSMAVKTPSPGAVYHIEHQYYTGPEKNKGISFNCDTRPPLYNASSSNAEVLPLKLPKGPSISIGARLKRKDLISTTPGAIYNINMKSTAPSFSFGKGKGNRFKEVGFLKEIE
jgi:hypothetical protein